MKTRRSACLFGVVVALVGPPALASPQYFGYYASAFYERGTGDYINDIKDHANLAWIADQFCASSACGCVAARQAGDPTPSSTPWLTQKLTEAQTAGMKVIVSVTEVFYPTGFDGSMYHTPDISMPFSESIRSARWTAFKCQIAPYLSSIAAFHLADEPVVAELSDLEHVARDYLADPVVGYPSIHRHIVFAALELAKPGFFLPPSVDWVAYDCYPGPWERCADDGRHKSVGFYYQQLKKLMTNLSPRPSIVLYPETYQNDFDPTYVEQATILERVEREVAIAETDPDVIAVLPFTWQAGPVIYPMVKAYYQSVGHHFLSGTPRWAFPSQISATTTFPGYPPENVLDADNSTFWTSGDYAAATVTLLYPDPLRVAGMDLVIRQAPATPLFSSQSVSGTYRSSSPVTLTTFAGNFPDAQPLHWSTTTSHSYSRIDVAKAPGSSWAAWGDITVRSDGATRILAEPINASQTYSSDCVNPTGLCVDRINASDGDEATMWNSGAIGTAANPQWIEFDLGAARSVTSIELVVGQNPTGSTTHVVSGGPDGGHLFQLGSALTGVTSDNQVLTLNGPFPGVRILKVSTTLTPSWVAWREVRVYSAP